MEGIDFQTLIIGALVPFVVQFVVKRQFKKRDEERTRMERRLTVIVIKIESLVETLSVRLGKEFKQDYDKTHSQRLNEAQFTDKE